MMAGAIANSILVLGPSGSGKSSLIRSALAAVGSGAVAMAPGDSEINSYRLFVGEANYLFKGFDDVEYLPALGQTKADGFRELLQWMQGLYKLLKTDVEAGKAPRYGVLGLDTVSATGRLAFNATLSKFGMTEPPPGRGEKSGPFYGYLAQLQESLMRPLMAIRGLGVHVIVAGHVSEKENVSEAAHAVHSSRMIVPAVPGGFRDTLPSYFDLVLHTGIANANGKLVHYLQWKPNVKRPTKSRLGTLDDKELIPNSWPELVKRIANATQP